MIHYDHALNTHIRKCLCIYLAFCSITQKLSRMLEWNIDQDCDDGKKRFTNLP